MKLEQLTPEDSTAGTRQQDELSQRLRFWHLNFEKQFWAIALMSLLVDAIAAFVAYCLTSKRYGYYDGK
jgi:hypothetical protein